MDFFSRQPAGQCLQQILSEKHPFGSRPWLLEHQVVDRTTRESFMYYCTRRDRTPKSSQRRSQFIEKIGDRKKIAP